MEKTSSTHTTARIVLILVLGFCLRLAGLVEGQGFSHFAATDSFEAYSVAVDYGLGEPRAQYIGQPNYNRQSKLPGPLWALFCFTGLRFWGSIQGAIFFTILLNTAAIYLIFLLAQRTLGPPCGLVAGLAAATLPFPIYYSAFLYNPNVMPFLGGLTFLALWDVVGEDRSPRIFWVALLLLIMPQFHLSVFAIVPAVIIMLVITPKRLSVPWLVAGLFAGAFFYIPYLRGEMTHGWENTLEMRTGKDGNWWGGLKAVIAPWNLLVNIVPQWTPNFSKYREMGNACFGWFGVLIALNIFSAAVAILMLAGVFWEIRKTMQGYWRSPREAFKRSPGIFFLAVLLIVPLFCLLVGRQSFHARYSIVLLPPLLSLVAGAVLKWFARPRWGKWVIGAAIVVIMSDLWLMPAFFSNQGLRIQKSSDVFYASFSNLEIVYQHLKANAGLNRSVQVDDSAYNEKFGSEGNRADVKLIRRYVAVREKESAAISHTSTRPAIFTICRADTVNAADTAVAYRDHGIALVLSQTPP